MGLGLCYSNFSSWTYLRFKCTKLKRPFKKLQSTILLCNIFLIEYTICELMERFTMNSKIPVIDIFAGPGGLGEGFSSLSDGNAFNIVLSIEKDIYAHKTLVTFKSVGTDRFQPAKLEC